MTYFPSSIHHHSRICPAQLGSFQAILRHPKRAMTGRIPERRQIACPRYHCWHSHVGSGRVLVLPRQLLWYYKVEEVGDGSSVDQSINLIGPWLNSLTLTVLSQCWAPVCLINPSGALTAAKVARLAKIKLLKEGKRCEAHRFVACTTAFVFTFPLDVFTVIQPAASRSETLKAGVCAWTFKLPVLRTMCSRAWTNLYGHLRKSDHRRFFR